MFKAFLAKLQGQDDGDKKRIRKDKSQASCYSSPFLSARIADMDRMVSKNYLRLTKKVEPMYSKFENAYFNLIYAEKRLEELEGVNEETICNKRELRDMTHLRIMVINDMLYLEGKINNIIAIHQAKAKFQEAKVNAIVGAYLEGAELDIAFLGVEKPFYTVHKDYEEQFNKTHDKLELFKEYKEKWITT